MQENTNQNLILHNVFIEERKKISITGIEDVLSFDEECIVLTTQSGELTIKGQKLHISNLSVETGDILAEGDIITAVFYNENTVPKNKSLFGRIFK